MRNALPPRHELIFMGIALVANVLLDVALLAGRAAIEEMRPEVCPDYVRYGAEGFLLGCFFSIGTMHGIMINRFSKISADRINLFMASPEHESEG